MTYDDHVRLNIISSNSFELKASEARFTLKCERLTALFQLPAVDKWYDGIVDTGSLITVFPEQVWKTHEREIRWFTSEQDSMLPEWLSRVNGLGGGGFPCRIGQVFLLFRDVDRRTLRPRLVTAKCCEDGGDLKRTLIGLGGGSLSSRRLEVIYSTKYAWLREMM